MASELKDRLKIASEIVGGVGVVSDKTGIPRRTIGYYLSGESEPKISAVLKIATVTGVTLDWLVTGEGPMTRKEAVSAPAASPQSTSLMDEFFLVPRYDVQASAGGGCLVDSEAVLDHYAFRRDWLMGMRVQKDKLALINVSGDSMEPVLHDGDLVMINMRDRKITGDAVYVIRVNDVLLAKRVQRMMDGSLLVKSDNPTYREQMIPSEHVEEVCIIGRVVWAGRKM